MSEQTPLIETRALKKYFIHGMPYGIIPLKDD